MQYMGSKNKLAKLLLPIILRNRKPGQLYYEPFVGGANMIDKVDGPRWANDSNYYLIQMWRALQRGWKPPTTVTKEQYDNIRKNIDKYDPALVAFVGFLCSFGGKWFGGYAKNSKGDNYALRGANVLLKQIQNLKDVQFFNKSYDEVRLEEKCIIYCDPPYSNTTKYKDGFDHGKFWQWCREMKLQGHDIYISEYTAPEDFILLKTITYKTKLNKNQDSVRVEKLYTL